MNDFSEKVALVSGSSRGIGRAIGNQLVARGCKVAYSGRHEEPSLRSNSSFFFTGDLTDAKKCEEFAARARAEWGRIDHVVCNVGNGTPGKIQGSETTDEWLQSLRVNLLSSISLIEACLPDLKKAGGSIVCISSICGSDSRMGPSPYAAAKAGLEMAVRKYARGLASSKIRINAIEPGNILFPGGQWEKKMAAESTAVKAMIADQVPLGRFGSPEEIANAAIFLLSDLSAFTTGSILKVDGGQSA